jgi:hypothetical protein
MDTPPQPAPWLVAALVGAGWAVVGALAIYLGIYWSVGGFPAAIWLMVAAMAAVCLAAAWGVSGRLGRHRYRWTVAAVVLALVLQVAAVVFGVGLSPVGALGLFGPVQLICLPFALLGTWLGARDRRPLHRRP